MRTELPPDFDGCGWKCRKTVEHCHEWGMCAHAPEPPCKHPVESIHFNPGSRRVECAHCGEHLTVREFAEESMVTTSIGCWCSDECDHESTPVGWSLNPAKVLAVLDADPGTQISVAFCREEYTRLDRAAIYAGKSVNELIHHSVMSRVMSILFAAQDDEETPR